jgi:hypothetical protein
MRHTNETGLRVPKTILIEDALSGTSDLAHLLPESGQSIGQSGESGKIALKPWQPKPLDEHFSQDNGMDCVVEKDRAALELLLGNTATEAVHPVSNILPRVGRLWRRRFAAFAIAALGAAAFIGLYFEVVPLETGYARLQGVYRIVSEQLLRQVADESKQLKKTSEAKTAELQWERQKTAMLTSELATTRRDFETKIALSSKESDEAAKLRGKAEAATAELQQEHQKTEALTSELAAMRHDFETKIASSSKASDEAAKLRGTAEAATAELQQERQKTEALTSELAKTRRDFETEIASSSKASDEAAKLRGTAEAATAELQQERQKTEALTSELATARRDVDTAAAMSRKARDEAAELRKKSLKRRELSCRESAKRQLPRCMIPRNERWKRA